MGIKHITHLSHHPQIIQDFLVSLTKYDQISISTSIREISPYCVLGLCLGFVFCMMEPIRMLLHITLLYWAVIGRVNQGSKKLITSQTVSNIWHGDGGLLITVLPYTVKTLNLHTGDIEPLAMWG